MDSDITDIKSTVYVYLFIAAISVLALGSTFALSAVELPFVLKTVVFAVIVAIYLICFALLCVKFERRSFEESQPRENPSNPFSPEIEEKLQVLEEASEFFTASLKPADMFRLIAGRIGEIIPFAACVLLLPDEHRTRFKISRVIGEHSRALKNLSIGISEGLAGKAFQMREGQIDKNLFRDKKVFPPETIGEFKSAIAVPLKRGGESFGVLQLFGNSESSFDQNAVSLLEAIGERIIPLLNGSVSFERNLSSAMTDLLTNLPNERAFYLVLENQIAGAQRLPEKRNLAVLVIDIKNFDELNKAYGHSVGDKILAFTAQTIKTQLRQMDFLSRSMNDEFFAVLPTADKDIAERIVRRIEKTFVLEPFRISDQIINVGLNFGFASFNTEGETANQLLKTALLKKLRSKSAADKNILWFPKEFVN